MDEGSAPLATELKQVGWDVRSPWELVNTPVPYESAIPVLLQHLDGPYLDRNREGIGRALAVKEAAYAWPILRAAYEKEPPDTGMKTGLAVALSAIAKPDRRGELIELVSNPVHGRTRIFFVDNLRRSRSPEAKATLDALADDPDLGSDIARYESKR